MIEILTPTYENDKQEDQCLQNNDLNVIGSEFWNNTF